MPELIYNESYCDKIVQVLGGGKSIASVAKNFGVARRTIYEWRDKHPEFAEALRLGMDASQEYWEEIGHDGVLGEVKNFSAATWIFIMKNRFRDDYKDKEKEDTSDSQSVLEKIISGELKVKND